MTTEHFTLQGARTAAITESTSRATIFIGAVSAGLVALGLIATATRIGTAFYAFGLILLSTLSFLGFVTLDRVLQSGIEELHYAALPGRPGCLVSEHGCRRAATAVSTAAEQIRFALAQLRTPCGHHLFERHLPGIRDADSTASGRLLRRGTTGTITRARSWMIRNRDLLSQGVAHLRTRPDRSHEA